MGTLKTLTEIRDLETKQTLFGLTESFRLLHRMGNMTELMKAVGAARTLAQSNCNNAFLKPYCETAMHHVVRYESTYSIDV